MNILFLELALALTGLQTTLAHAQIQIAPPAHEVLPIQSDIKIATTSPTFFNKDGITEENSWNILDRLISCESSGRRGIQILDVNKKMSRGELMFQDKTWEWMSKMAGVEGSPLERGKAIQVARWALLNNYGSHWSCFGKVMGGLARK